MVERKKGRSNKEGRRRKINKVTKEKEGRLNTDRKKEEE